MLTLMAVEKYSGRFDMCQKLRVNSCRPRYFGTVVAGLTMDLSADSRKADRTRLFMINSFGDLVGRCGVYANTTRGEVAIYLIFTRTPGDKRLAVLIAERSNVAGRNTQKKN